MANLEYLLVVGAAMTAFGGIAFMLMRVLVAATEIESFLFVLPFG
jgi:hypothetical protein